MHLVPGTKDERDATSRRQRRDLTQQVASLTQLAFVAPLELRPLFWIVSEPSAQLRGGGDLFHPFVDRRTSLTHATRPKPVDQDAAAIRAGCGLVRALES